jgi:hypothetical protein
MPRIIVEKPKYVQLEEFVNFWEYVIKARKQSTISSTLLNEAYEILYGQKPKNNCSTCLRKRAQELNQVYDKNRHILQLNELQQLEDDIINSNESNQSEPTDNTPEPNKDDTANENKPETKTTPKRTTPKRTTPKRTTNKTTTKRTTNKKRTTTTNKKITI